MEKERVNLIIRNLELLLDSLKAEVNSDRDDKVDYNPYSEYIEDYDEVFEDDDDNRTKIKKVKDLAKLFERLIAQDPSL